MTDTDKSELALTIKINRLMPHDTWCDPIERCSCGQESRRKDMLALITQQCNQARRKAYQVGLLTGAMPEAIGKPLAQDYLAKFPAQAKETEGA